MRHSSLFLCMLCLVLITPAALAKFCVSCGYENMDEARFCVDCGAGFKVSEAKPDKIDEIDEIALEMREDVEAARSDYLDMLIQLEDYLLMEDKKEEAAKVKAEVEAVSGGTPAAVAVASESPELLARALFEFAAIYRESFLKKEQRYKTALEAYEELLLLFPKSSYADETAYWIGDMYASKYMHDLDKSRSYFQKCADWNPDTELDPRFRIGQIYEKQIVDFEEAVRYYRKASKESANPRVRKKALSRIADLTGAAVLQEKEDPDEQKRRR